MNMLKKIYIFVKQNMKKWCIYLEHLFVWFMVNFLFGILPIITSVIIGDKNYDQIYASFIAYIYTLVIVNIYIFENYLKTTKAYISLSWLIKWISILMAFIFIIYFILFNVKVNTVYPLEGRSMILISIGIFISSFILSIFLNFPSLSRNIKEELQSIPIEKMELAEKNIDSIYKRLQQEG